MAWNKCSEKLPEVGMLVVTREKITKFDDYIESEQEYHVRLMNNYSCTGYAYTAGTVYQEDTSLLLNFGNGEYRTTLIDDLEWKEVEKD